MRVQEHLFSRFFRTSTSRTRRTPGTGLGLVIASGIVRSHGGRVGIESTEGEGTIVHIHLPRAVARSPVPPGARSHDDRPAAARRPAGDAGRPRGAAPGGRRHAGRAAPQRPRRGTPGPARRAGPLSRTLHEIGEFFVIRAVRRQRVGYEAAMELLRLHPGRWRIPFQEENRGAARFWRRVAADAAGAASEKEERQVPGKPGTSPDTWLLLSTRLRSLRSDRLILARVRSGDGPLSVRGRPSSVKGTRRSFQDRFAESIFGTHP
jgi:hypothetical protein